MISLDAQFIHSKIEESLQYLWFTPKPNEEINIADNNIKSQLLKIYMETELSIEKRKTRGILHDPVLSHYLNANVYYFAEYRFKPLVNQINKKGFSISPEIFYLKLRFEDKYFIIALNFKHNEDKGYLEWPGVAFLNLETICVNMQQLYGEEVGYRGKICDVTSWVSKKHIDDETDIDFTVHYIIRKIHAI